VYQLNLHVPAQTTTQFITRVSVILKCEEQGMCLFPFVLLLYCLLLMHAWSPAQASLCLLLTPSRYWF
jgi:hypothetical protein